MAGRLPTKINTPVGEAPVIPLIMMMIGGYLMWFGVHYFESDQKWPTDPIKAVLQGKPVTPSSYTEEAGRSEQNAAYIAQFTGAAVAGATAAGAAAGAASTGASIAAAAQKYVGQGYVWGGHADKPGNWDCSSFVSYVLGHDLGLPLPGGKWGAPGFPPAAHGPTTGAYALFGTAINASQVTAGDLVVWSTHIGIAIDNSHIVSARDVKEGTGISTIAGTTASLGESVFYRRVA
jgi:cell wall-associated NlpC family hydrolase